MPQLSASSLPATASTTTPRGFGSRRTAQADHDAQLADVDIMCRMSLGDAAALAALYDRHSTSVYSHALRVVRHREDAEDVSQQVFTQAWKSSARYDASRGAVAAWLLMMTRSRAIDCLRTRQPEDEGAPAADAVDPQPSVEAAATTRQSLRRMRTAIEGLPGDQRVAVELFYVAGLSHAEIAARLSAPIGTVKTRIRAGLQKLRLAVAVASQAPPRALRVL